MHYALASAILHGPDKAPLYSLTLNNVLEGGLLRTNEAFRFWRSLPDGGHRIYSYDSDITECWKKLIYIVD